MAAHDERLLEVDEVEYGVQVNGKVRDRMRARKDASDAELEKSAFATPKIAGRRRWKAGAQDHHRARQAGKYRARKIGSGQAVISGNAQLASGFPWATGRV